MSVKNYVTQILEELKHNVDYEQDSQLDSLVDAILDAKHIFLTGAGRSGVAIRAFANRLMHLGLSVSVIGEITSPHTHEGDLLIVGSGSGETDSLVSTAKKAKKSGLKVAILTMDVQSTIAKLADVVVLLPGVSPKLKNAGMDITSIQPMGSAFEQLLLLTGDGIILELMDQMGETSDSMFERHADLE